MRPYIFGGSALLAVLLVVAFGYADQTRLHWVAEAPPTEPLASPDRVVGIEWRCTVRSGGTSDEMRGTGICLAADGVRV